MCRGGGRPITAFEISGGLGMWGPGTRLLRRLSSTHQSTRVWRGGGTMTLLPRLQERRDLIFGKWGSYLLSTGDLRIQAVLRSRMTGRGHRDRPRFCLPPPPAIWGSTPVRRTLGTPWLYTRPWRRERAYCLLAPETCHGHALQKWGAQPLPACLRVTGHPSLRCLRESQNYPLGSRGKH